MIVVGIDAGSRAIKVVLLDRRDGRVLAKGRADQGVEADALVQGLLDGLLAVAGAARDQVRYTVATGYARNLVSTADTTITEITCHARGVFHLRPEARTVVEIGGQDSKLLRLDERGAVRDFYMNDRCAAGTGSFIELAARRLGVGLEALGDLARNSRSPASISSMCAVFAETEIIGLLAGGAAKEDVIAGVQRSVAQRIASMAGRDVQPPVVFTGGVALVPGMDRALAQALSHDVAVCPDPQMSGALGAALLARERAGTRA
jgi:predicted CoA-substrate-specific enzyme activase